VSDKFSKPTRDGNRLALISVVSMSVFSSIVSASNIQAIISSIFERLLCGGLLVWLEHYNFDSLENMILTIYTEVN